MLRTLCLSLCLILSTPCALRAAEPIEALKATVDKVLTLLQDPRYTEPSLHEEQRQKIWALTRDVFDFDLIAKRAAGRYHWENSFNPAQRREFTDLFSEFLAGVYMVRLKGQFTDLKIEYAGQEIDPAGRQAKVKTRVRQKDLQTPIDYSMVNNDGRWKVYDIFVEGISLAQNYQSQFRSLLERQSAAKVIEQLRDKVAEQKTAATTPAGRSA